MLRVPVIVAIGLVSIGLAVPARAVDLVDELGKFQGYTIVGTKRIDGYRDKNGKISDDFEGCDFGRVIAFTDGTTLTCSTFHFRYSFRPTAAILVKPTEYQGHRFGLVVMIVRD